MSKATNCLAMPPPPKPVCNQFYKLVILCSLSLSSFHTLLQGRKRGAPTSGDELGDEGSPRNIAKRISIETPSPTSVNPPPLTPLITGGSTTPTGDKKLENSMIPTFLVYDVLSLSLSLPVQDAGLCVHCQHRYDQITFRQQHFVLIHSPVLIAKLFVL